ncbi:hypothetical protein SRHO_G00245130 [Serrasalmus rhombeus]
MMHCASSLQQPLRRIRARSRLDCGGVKRGLMHCAFIQLLHLERRGDGGAASSSLHHTDSPAFGVNGETAGASLVLLSERETDR